MISSARRYADYADGAGKHQVQHRPLLAHCILAIAIAIFAATTAISAPGDKTPIGLDFPTLAGSYHAGNNVPSADPSSRTVSFTIPDSVAAVGLLRLVVSATWTKGIVEVSRTVGGFTYYDTLSLGMPLEMTVSAPSAGECYLDAQVGGQDGAWTEADYLSSVCLSGEPLPSDLIGLDLTAEFGCDFVERPNVRLIQDASGIVNSVSLELWNVVSDEASTWGAVKALYR